MSSLARSARRPPAPAVASRLSSRRGWLLISLFGVALAISAFSILRGISPFDEGVSLQAARRVAAGQVPYRDFQWAYGPLEPYLLALAIKLFGTSLLPWRILRSLLDAGVALVSYLLVAERARRPVALAIALAVACEMAEPTSANPLPYALLGVLVALHVVSRSEVTGRRVAGACLLTALAAAFRLDFGLYGLAAVTVAFAARGQPRRVGWYLAGAIALIVAVYLPFAVLDGPGNLYQALIGVSLRTGSYWTLPFPLDFHAPPGAGVAKTLKHGIDFYLPLALVVGFGLAAAGAALALVRRDRRAPLLAGLTVFGAGLLVYLLSRTDQFHAQPLFVVVAVGLGLAAAAFPGPLRVLCFAMLALLLVHGLANRLSALARPPAEVPLAVPVADGVMVPPQEARGIERMVALVDARVPAGRPIYVLPRRSDLVTLSDPLIYVFTQRENPTYHDFGLQSGARAQARIVRALGRLRLPILVRWTDPISSRPEPNPRGRSTGVHTLDRWVAVHYRVLGRLYHYDVLIARP
jgi:hypothetical protein